MKNVRTLALLVATTLVGFLSTLGGTPAWAQAAPVEPDRVPTSGGPAASASGIDLLPIVSVSLVVIGVAVVVALALARQRTQRGRPSRPARA